MDKYPSSVAPVGKLWEVCSARSQHSPAAPSGQWRLTHEHSPTQHPPLFPGLTSQISCILALPAPQALGFRMGYEGFCRSPGNRCY